MRIDNPTKEQIEAWNHNLKKYIETNYKFYETKYIDLGVKVVRVLSYSKEFSALAEKQLSYSIKDHADKYDATLILWQEKDIKRVAFKIMPELLPKNDLKERIRIMHHMFTGQYLWVYDKNYSIISSIIYADLHRKITELTDFENNTYFLGVENLDPEEFIKEGHIFVQIFNKILKTPSTNLVHGASVGLNNKGILFCARGQRGKSTLAVLSMMKGFEYVSDDYLTLEKTDKGLSASPIYSIITLSPRMYNELFDKLKNCRFLFNNARKDKYVIEISDFHKQFKKNYPIDVCMFPEIVDDKEPSVVKCGKEEKGRAIVQLVQSSVSQMQDINNQEVIKKIYDMVKDYEFYKINLCSDIDKNTECLREFIKNYKPQKDNTPLDRFLVDITFDIANILDTKTFTIYTMNKFATNIYDNIIHGVNLEKVLEEFSKMDDVLYKTICQIRKLGDMLKEMGVIETTEGCGISPRVNRDFISEDNKKLSFIEYKKDSIIDLLN